MKNGGITLVMAGAREAHDLIAGLLRQGRQVIASLPEPERMFDAFPVQTRTGVFEDADVLQDWLRQQGVTCVVDASHAFDAEVSDQVAGVCAGQNLRYLRLLRPRWRATREDRWTSYASIRDAAIDVASDARVFSNTGRGSLADLADFAGDRLFLRQTQTTAEPPPLDFVTYVPGTPPFSQRSEEALFRELRISRLMCRNVGGAASQSKLLAARRLGICVSMIERPPAPLDMPVVTEVAEALAWEADP